MKKLRGSAVPSEFQLTVISVSDGFMGQWRDMCDTSHLEDWHFRRMRAFIKRHGPKCAECVWNPGTPVLKRKEESSRPEGDIE